MLNSNKKGITLDLKIPRGKALFQDLVAHVDMVVENFAVEVMDKLGLGYEVLKQKNPQLVCASSPGYGRSGPYSSFPAFDPIIQAMIGVMSTTGFDDDPPLKAGPPILDGWVGFIWRPCTSATGPAGASLLSPRCSRRPSTRSRPNSPAISPTAAKNTDDPAVPRRITPWCPTTVIRPRTAMCYCCAPITAADGHCAG